MAHPWFGRIRFQEETLRKLVVIFQRSEVCKLLISRSGSPTGTGICTQGISPRGVGSELCGSGGVLGAVIPENSNALAWSDGQSPRQRFFCSLGLTTLPTIISPLSLQLCDFTTFTAFLSSCHFVHRKVRNEHLHVEFSHSSCYKMQKQRHTSLPVAR